jgi:alpha-mannosidase
MSRISAKCLLSFFIFAAVLPVAARAVAAETPPPDPALAADVEQQLKLVPPGSRYKISLIGHAHIDMAWLWDWRETVEVCRNTFTSVLGFMDQFPDFKFSQSQAQAYEWMEQDYPEIFEKIKKRVAEGRWEIVGGMWVEPDGNLPNGESFVRQLLYGKRYFKQKFGVDVKVGWTPDSFGYNWMLPQIYKKNGIDYFLTAKLLSNETNQFPYNIFNWQSPDGSTILSILPPGGYGQNITPFSLYQDAFQIELTTHSRQGFALYGVGDHGGGPTLAHLQSIEILRKEPRSPKLRYSTALEMFEGLESQKLKYPEVDTELYFEHHRGTYTTQANNKRNNRRSELNLMEDEKFSVIAGMFGLEYPRDELYKAWKKTLFNQFHDILPGSSIRKVYVDSDEDYREIFGIENSVLGNALGKIAGEVKSPGTGTPVVVFNPLSWERSDLVTLPLAEKAGGYEVADPASGAVLPTQKILAADGKPALIFYLKGVPSVGYRTVLMNGGSGSGAKSDLSATKTNMENRFFRVTIDSKTGAIQIYDKAAGRNVFDDSRRGNMLMELDSKPEKDDAWDMAYNGKEWDLNEAESIEVVESGPVRAVVRIMKSHNDSKFTQDIVIYNDIPRVDCQMAVDWRESHVLLKAVFPFTVKADTATYEIPYGTIQRSTHRVTQLEKARFEVPSHRFADLSDGQYGVAVLNDSKYGYDTLENVMRLTLLRSPKSPDPEADMHTHSFAYSILPHKGGWQQADVLRRAHEFNEPLLARVADKTGGALAPSGTFFSIAPDNVVLTVVKRAEDSDAVILRFYEIYGRGGEASLTLPGSPKSAAETDMQENELRPVSLNGNRITVPVGKYEIKTLKIVY